MYRIHYLRLLMPIAPWVLFLPILSIKNTCEAFAKKVLAKSTEKLGKGLMVETRHVFHVNLYEGIIEAARKSKGDVIVMASHKNTGLKGIMLGSETHAVIVHTNLPVLVLG